jgi:hypothetical protein
VETRVFIQPDYLALVREETRFWVTSGFDVRWGLSGLELNAETLETIAAGGIAFATPSDGGNRVRTGHRFPLADKADAAWQAWSPRLPSGPMRLDDDLPLPQPRRVLLEWTEKSFAFRRQHRRDALGVLTEDHRLLAPIELLMPPSDALEGSVVVVINGHRLALPPDRRTVHGSLAILALGAVPASARDLWPAERTRKPAGPENCWLISDLQPPVPLPVSRLALREAGGWQIHPSVPVLPEWHGAAVVAVADGCLVGLLIVDSTQSQAHVAPLP